MSEHRGEIIEKIVRKSGYSLTILAKRLYLSRNTLYKRFATSKLTYEFILAVGHVVGYDFSTVFPALKDIVQHTQNELWQAKDEYIALLENYSKLVVLAAKILACTNIASVREEVAEFIKTNLYTKPTSLSTLSD